jgi:cytochrome c oxidase assembly protein subunit 15
MANIINPQASDKTNRQISYWLFFVAFFILLMVAVGGLTRLTESGLSITEWKPIHGAIPPLNETEWLEEFELYKRIPEYQQINKGMSLEQFKTIFWWEYFHRLLGRLVGLVFFVPFAYFLVKGALSRKLKIKFTFFLLLGGAQGFMGWYMVQSGLSERVDVSHYRLAAHLGLALLLFVLLLSNAFKLYFSTCAKQPEISSPPSRKLKMHVNFLKLFLFTQIIFGAFVAGLNAGLVYNTWPLMDGDFVPAGFAPHGFVSFFEDIATVQFIHRWLAFVVIAIAICTFTSNRSEIRSLKLSKNFYILFALISAQIVLGIKTLLFVVPISLASLHQILAAILLGYVVFIFSKISYINTLWKQRKNA